MQLLNKTNANITLNSLRRVLQESKFFVFWTHLTGGNIYLHNGIYIVLQWSISLSTSTIRFCANIGRICLLLMCRRISETDISAYCWPVEICQSNPCLHSSTYTEFDTFSKSFNYIKIALKQTSASFDLRFWRVGGHKCSFPMTFP